MTKDELLKLTPEQVNEMAASKVMGWHKHLVSKSYLSSWLDSDDEIRYPIQEWRPMTSIANAWLLVEKLKGDYDEVNLYWDGASWDAQFSREGTDTRRAYFGCLANLIYPVATAPAAITLACVAAAMEVE